MVGAAAVAGAAVGSLITLLAVAAWRHARAWGAEVAKAAAQQ